MDFNRNHQHWGALEIATGVAQYSQEEAVKDFKRFESEDVVGWDEWALRYRLDDLRELLEDMVKNKENGDDDKNAYTVLTVLTAYINDDSVTDSIKKLALVAVELPKLPNTNQESDWLFRAIEEIG